MVDQAEIHRMVLSSDPKEREDAAVQLNSNFAILPDKAAAWQDLCHLSGDDDNDVRMSAAEAIGPISIHVPNKDAVWQDLIRLIHDGDNYVRMWAARYLGPVFIHVPNKKSAWKDLQRLTCDDLWHVRMWAAKALGPALIHVPNKELAWQDLQRLTDDDHWSVRWSAAESLGSAFSQVPDKESAWQDLQRLIRDDDSSVRWSAAESLGLALIHVPDKESSWRDLQRLTDDDHRHVRSSAANALGSAFSQVPDKDAAWQDLIRLSGDDDSDVRVLANHSLGKVSIFKATEAKRDEDFRKELENALGYFEKSAKEAKYSNPSNFCIPFYRSYYVLTCKKDSSKAEVEIYLKEAKEASEGSKSKGELLEAVENLATALKEAQKLHEMDLKDAQLDLKAYMQYCNRAAELLDDTKERAPSATRLVRRGLPIIGQRIKALLQEIEEESTRLRKATRDTPLRNSWPEDWRENKRAGQGRARERGDAYNGRDRSRHSCHVSLPAGEKQSLGMRASGLG